MKRLLVNLPDNVHASLREYAFKHNQSMSQTLVAALTTMAFFAEKAKDAPVNPKIKETAKIVTADLNKMFPREKDPDEKFYRGTCKHGSANGLCKYGCK